MTMIIADKKIMAMIIAAMKIDLLIVVKKKSHDNNHYKYEERSVIANKRP